MPLDVFDLINVKELISNKFSVNGVDAQGQTSGADQGALGAYLDGTKGLNTVGEMEKLVDLVTEIRSTLVANGMMKGSA